MNDEMNKCHRLDDLDLWERIDGAVYEMFSRSTEHQVLVGRLLTEFTRLLMGTSSEVLLSLFDVKLEVESNVNIVHPDLIVVSDPSMLSTDGCNGVPDLIVEVLSPESAVRDKREKFRLYRLAGVREYWVVHPYGLVEVYRLENGRYSEPSIYAKDDTVCVSVLNGVCIQLKEVFG